MANLGLYRSKILQIAASVAGCVLLCKLSLRESISKSVDFIFDIFIFYRTLYPWDWHNYIFSMRGPAVRSVCVAETVIFMCTGSLEVDVLDNPSTTICILAGPCNSALPPHIS